MKKWKVFLFLGVLSLSIISGCGVSDKKEKEARAEKVAIEFMKEKENKTFIIDNFDGQALWDLVQFLYTVILKKILIKRFL